MTWALILCPLILILGVRLAWHLLRFVLEALALYALFAIAALLTALLCVGAGHHGEFARAVIQGLTGGP
jgi:uncharacterized membrane protein